MTPGVFVPCALGLFCPLLSSPVVWTRVVSCRVVPCRAVPGIGASRGRWTGSRKGWTIPSRYGAKGKRRFFFRHQSSVISHHWKLGTSLYCAAAFFFRGSAGSRENGQNFCAPLSEKVRRCYIRSFLLYFYLVRSLPCLFLCVLGIPVSPRGVPPYARVYPKTLSLRFTGGATSDDGRSDFSNPTTQAIENPSAVGGYEIKVTPEDPSSRSIRLVTEMMVLVGEGMGRYENNKWVDGQVGAVA